LGCPTLSRVLCETGWDVSENESTLAAERVPPFAKIRAKGWGNLSFDFMWKGWANPNLPMDGSLQAGRQETKNR